MSQSNLELAALIGSRICHDLISPIGAISNGMELMAMSSGVGNSPEMALISESVENANARIRFFRVAFGMSSEGQMIGKNEVCSILAGIAKGARVEFDWAPQSDLARSEAQAVFLAIQCLESAMPFGGTIRVTERSPGWAVVGAAPKLRHEDLPWDVMERPEEGAGVAPAQVQFALLPQVLNGIGKRLTLEREESEISIVF